MVKAFTSYSREDSDFVDGLYDTLDTNGVDVWLDRVEMTGGDNWQEKLVGAIKECDIFLLIISPNLLHSRYVLKEVALSDKYQRRIIPIHYQKTQVPNQIEFAIAGLHMIDYTIQSHEQATRDLLQVFDINNSTVKPAPARPKENRRILHKILPGNWQVQLSIQTNWGPQSSFLNISLHFNGTFQIQNQMFRAWGTWALPQLNFLMLNGQQSNGFMNMPYQVMIQFTDISEHILSGLTSGNEGASWRRLK